MTTKKPRTTEGFTTLDDLLDRDGTREAFQAVAIKEVLAWQIQEAMEDQGRISRLLDPADDELI